MILLIDWLIDWLINWLMVDGFYTWFRLIVPFYFVVLVNLGRFQRGSPMMMCNVYAMLLTAMTLSSTAPAPQVTCNIEESSDV